MKLKRERPGDLSVRAVNQYRRRDVLTYLGLRYYLNNSAACTDQWLQWVATDLVLTRTNQPYLRAFHFKEVTDQGDIEYRPIFLPSANEALAEAVLLEECGKRPNGFANPSCVFSYYLNFGKNRSGIFQHYIDGLRNRHKAIADACDGCPGGMVRYVDVKRFYPSISKDLAVVAWHRQSDIAGLPDLYRDLGEKLINDHGAANGNDKCSILTGPMFSHLLGNLVLRELDEAFMQKLPAKYFRYVDDITLVGEADAVVRSLQIVRSRLGDLGLELHDDSSPKSIKVPSSEWLKGRNDFRQSRRPVSWMTLIADLKRFLLQYPEEHIRLQTAFRDEGFRIPVRDYTAAIHERNFLERIRQLAEMPWFRRKSRTISVNTLLDQARQLRKTYAEELKESMVGADKTEGYERKRRIPKLRYRAGRLIYLAPEDELAQFALMAEELPELYFHSKVMKAVACTNIDNVLSLGTNAAQAIAQPIKAAGRQVNTSLSDFSAAEEQALAVFFFNGVPVDRPKLAPKLTSELMRFASTGVDITLMKSSDAFIQELACLHGLSEHPRHPDFLEIAFDEDEELAMDAVMQLQQSLSA